MYSARTVAVVVPSPATSLVLLAASFTSWAPIFSYGSCSSMSSATVTPSLVTVGLPQPLSRTALRPRGPSVLRTARASLLTPDNSFCRASSLYASCFDAIKSVSQVGSRDSLLQRVNEWGTRYASDVPGGSGSVTDEIANSCAMPMSAASPILSVILAVWRPAVIQIDMPVHK